MAGADAGVAPGRSSVPTGTAAPGPTLLRIARVALEAVTDNKALSVLVYIGFVFVKVLAVSAWRLPTALGVLNVSSLPAVVAGATLSALPMIFVAALTVIGYAWLAGYWHGRWAVPESQAPSRLARLRDRARCNASFVWIVLALSLAVLVMAPWQFAVLGLVVAVLFGGVAGAVAARAPSIRPALLGAVLIILIGLSYSQLVSAVWIPHEDLLLRDGHHRVGYVLGDDDGQTTLLRSHTRLLVIVPDADVESRRVCAVKGSYQRASTAIATSPSVLLLVLGRSDLPECSRN